ncbi:MAG: hypothetical protein L3K07_00615 [Thermoplasmata archaeon]|nr:hypothetical protein [Thermoplasmata archaeon]
MIENVEEGFDEATLHLLREPSYANWSSGPVLPIPLDDLAAGELGWFRKLEGPKGRVLVEYHLLPRSGRASSPRAPLRRDRSGELALHRVIPGSPPGTLVVRAATPAEPRWVRALLDDLSGKLSASEEE